MAGMLRAPVIFDRIFLFSLVVAMLLVFVRLIRQHELVALLGFGISVPKQLMLLAPIVLGTSLAAITVIDYTLPPAVRALQAWGIGEYKIKNITPNNPLWLEDKGKIVKASERYSYQSLGKLEIFERDEMGAVTGIFWADRASFTDKGWVLDGIQKLDLTDNDGEPRMALRVAGTQIWDTSQTPKTIARLAAEPRDVSLSEMRNFRKRGNSGSKPRFAYSFWHAHRLTRPLAALILLLCVVPMMQRTGREDSGDKSLLLGITMGFIFLIIDGAMATFATSGGMTVTTAIAFPLALFALIGTFLCLRTEAL